MNRRTFLLGLLGVAPAAAVAKEAEPSPASINDFIRAQVRASGDGWHRVSPTETWEMKYVGEPIKLYEGHA